MKEQFRVVSCPGDNSECVFLSEKDEYIITGVIEGDGITKGILGSFQVMGTDGVVFSVRYGPLLTEENRAELWKIRGELIGRVLIVKREKLKAWNSIPLRIVALELA